MNHSTNHCSLCGKNTEGHRNNGYRGSATLDLRWNGNGGGADIKASHLCFDCGKEMHEKIKELKRTFTVKTIVEYE